MGYFYLLCVAVLFSFGGTYVKLIKPFFSSEYITFFRFAVGVLFLLLLKRIKKQHFGKDFFSVLKTCLVWIVIGAAAKWLAYLAENYALAHGHSYGNIVTQPVQTVLLTCVSIFLFKEKMTVKKVICIFLCIFGVLCISWNGKPLSVFFGENLFLTFLFVLSGIFAGFHVLSQKMIADKMDIIDSNLAIFALASLLAFTVTVPTASTGFVPETIPGIACIFAILMFGFNTGIGFYLNAKAIPLVPFYMVPIIQSTMVIFSLTWGILFFHEPVSVYVVVGTLVFVAGIIGLQLSNSRSGKKKEADK